MSGAIWIHINLKHPSDVLSFRVLRHRRSVEVEGVSEVRLGLGIIIYGNGCALRNFTEPLPITNLLNFVNWYDLNFYDITTGSGRLVTSNISFRYDQLRESPCRHVTLIHVLTFKSTHSTNPQASSGKSP